MVRSIIGVIVGYLALFVLVAVALIVLFMLMGTEWSFKPNSFEASNAWIAMSLVANFIIAVIGGLICAVIAKGGKAPIVLAAIVFVLGLVLAIPSMMAHKQNAGLVRKGNVSQWEAMQKANEPIWVPFTVPFIGAAGVLLGAKIRRA